MLLEVKVAVLSISFQGFWDLLLQRPNQKTVAILEDANATAVYRLSRDGESVLALGSSITPDQLAATCRQVFSQRCGCPAGDLGEGLGYEVIGEEGRLSNALRQIGASVV